MNRREMLKLTGVGAVALCVPKLNAAQLRSCDVALTITRPNFDVVRLYDHETLLNYNVNDRGTSDFNLEQMFHDIDWDSENANVVCREDWDVMHNRWEKIQQHCKQLDAITAVKKFVWAGWITGNGCPHRACFHLFLMGQDDRRFNYRPDKVYMWERQMYAGDGMGGKLAKFEFADGTIFHGNCNRYWCSQIGNRAVQRYRYALATEAA